MTVTCSYATLLKIDYLTSYIYNDGRLIRADVSGSSR